MNPLAAAFHDRFGLSVPRSFAEFEARGYFDGSGSSYLHLNDMEWMLAADVRSFSFQPYQSTKFVPFATSGRGDLWAWDPEVQPFGEPRVLACWRDSEEATVYAPTFLAAVYRQLLDIASSAALSKVEVEAGRTRLLYLSRTLADLLPLKWRVTLGGIATNSVQTIRSNGRCPTDWFFLVSDREFKDILKADIVYSDLDGNVTWQRSDS